MYREIIEKEGRKWDDCKVLAFAFDGPGGPEIFHYELMYPLRPVYHLFDCSGTWRTLSFQRTRKTKKWPYSWPNLAAAKR